VPPRNQGAARCTGVDEDSTAIYLDRPPGYRQAQPRAPIVTGPGLIETKEPVEDPFAVLRRHAWAMVGNGQDGLAPLGTHADVDGRARWSVLDRVVHDVGDGLAEHQPVGGYRDAIGRIDRNLLPAFLRQDPMTTPRHESAAPHPPLHV